MLLLCAAFLLLRFGSEVMHWPNTSVLSGGSSGSLAFDAAAAARRYRLHYGDSFTTDAGVVADGPTIDPAAAAMAAAQAKERAEWLAARVAALKHKEMSSAEEMEKQEAATLAAQAAA